MLHLGENLLLARSTCLTANFVCQLLFSRAHAQGLLICVGLWFGFWLELGCTPACGNWVNSPMVTVDTLIDDRYVPGSSLMNRECVSKEDYNSFWEKKKWTLNTTFADRVSRRMKKQIMALCFSAPVLYCSSPINLGGGCWQSEWGGP